MNGKRTDSHDAVRAGIGMMIRRLAALAATACALALTAGAAGGERAVNELAKLTDPQGQEWDQFGFSVAADGDVMVVGARNAGCPGSSGPGRVLVYRYDGSEWVLEASLESPDPDLDADFGTAVAIEGETIVVGDESYGPFGDPIGAAYIFQFDGQDWLNRAKLLASDGAERDDFGQSVAVHDDIVVVGADRDDDLGDMSGSAYVFRRERRGWVEEAKLLQPNGQALMHFGYTASIVGDRILIGGGDAPPPDETGPCVFRFDGESWILESILLPPQHLLYDGFGTQTCMEGEVAVVGARLDDEAGPNAGAAYIFRREGSDWTLEAKLMAGDAGEDDWFATDVAIAGDVVIVGADHDNDNGDDSGSAYVFAWDGAEWSHHSKLLPSDGVADAHFGWSVALHGDRAIVGAYCDDDHGDNSGSAYVFSASEPDEDCNNNGVPDYIDIANGTSQDCNENAVPDECDIMFGTSEDCNENGIPDECDIADLTSWDCNQNGIPDECDIASGYSEDVNGDGIPDECWFPGEGGVIPLMQTRTLWVHCRQEYPEYCEYEEEDQAPDFSPYANALEVDCGISSAGASQESTVARTDVRATGSAAADGIYGGGHSADGESESIYDLTFSAPYTVSVLLSGEISVTRLWEDPVPMIARVTLIDSEQQELFREELVYEEYSASLEFHEAIGLEQDMEYILRAEAWTDANGSITAGLAEYDLELRALGDVDGDWDVDTGDLLALLGAWGPQEDHPADFDGDGDVDTADLLALLGNWGP